MAATGADGPELQAASARIAASAATGRKMSIEHLQNQESGRT